MMALDFDRVEAPHGGSAEQAFGPYFRAVVRHWGLVAIVTFLAVAVALFTLSRVSPTYQASASILITPLPQSSSSFVGISTVVETGDPARDVQTAAALIDTPGAARLGAEKLGPPWTEGNVLNAVSIAPRGASEVLAVTGQASTAAAAARVANAFADGAIAYRAGIVQQQISTSLAALEARLPGLPQGSAEAAAAAATVAQLRAVQAPGREPTMSVSQTAQPPGSPSGTSRLLVILLALVGGFALGSIAALGIETFRPSVRDREDALDSFPLPVLASLPRIRRRYRSRDFAPWSFTPGAFEQMRMLRDQLLAGRRAPVVLVASAGPGDGKTTVAAALAAAFAEIHDEVILMDCDLRKPDLSRRLESESDRADSTPPAVPASLDAGLPIPQLPGVKFIPALEGDIAKIETLMRRVAEVIAQGRETERCMIIDSPPLGAASEALRIARYCDEVVIVVRSGHTNRRQLRLAREVLDRNDAPVAGMVLIGDELASVRDYNGYGYRRTFTPVATGAAELAEKRRADGEPTRARPGSR